MKKNLWKSFNFVKNKITTVTQTAVNKTVNLLEENQSGEYLKDLYIALKNKQLYIDQETYDKQYIPLNKYYHPEPQNSNPILYIGVISFNQKKGAIVEFTYPDIDTLKNNKESNEYLESLCDKNNKDLNTIEKVIENINYQLTYLCMPDGAHILKNDSQFFLIQNLQKLLYGISCYRQLQTTPAMKEDEQENTRDYIQKAMCIVSKVPLFGQMASKLSVTMLAYFNQESLKDKKIIEELYSNYKISIMKSINVSEILASFSLKKLLSLTGEKVFSIMKLIMLEKKILVYSHISNNVCSFIFSFLSLFPCNAFFNLDYNGTGSKFYNQCYKPYGLPLKFLNKNSVLYSLMTLYDITYLEQKNIKSYFIGTTNPIFMNYKKLEFDCIINIDENKIIFNKSIGSSVLRLGKKERDLMKLINKQCSLNTLGLNNDNMVSGELVFEESDNINQINSPNKEHKDNNIFYKKKNSLYSKKQKSKEIIEEEIEEDDINFEEFKGTDDFIRNIFKKYITDFLADIALVKYLVFQEEIDINKNEDNLIIHSSNKKISDLKQVLSGYNYSFILKWITTSKNFKYWNYEHDPNLWTLSEHLGSIGDVSKYYENGDHYLGEMKNGLPDGNGTLNTILDGMGYTYIGQFKNGKKNGKGNLSSKDNKYNYDGGWREDKKNGVGTLFDYGDKYTGDFKDDKYCGNGTLCGKNGEIYECEFKDGKPDGLGRVTLVNGDVYTGNFVKGKISGQVSIKYKNGDSYNGYYKNGCKCGYGCFFSNKGDSYEGNFLNDLYDGEGKLTKADGEIIKGIFKNGILDKKLEKLKSEEEKEKEKKYEKDKEDKKENAKNTENEKVEIERKEDKLQNEDNKEKEFEREEDNLKNEDNKEKIEKEEKENNLNNKEIKEEELGKEKEDINQKLKEQKNN